MDIFSRPVAECDADKEVKKGYWRTGGKYKIQ